MNSTLTRFRVQTALPLEPLKAWHAVSPEMNIKSVEDLKRDIVQTLGLIEADGEIVLELDGFALLASSPVEIVRDDDIVTVRCKPRTDKRKATQVVDQPNKKQKTQPLVPSLVQPSSSTVNRSSKPSASTEPSLLRSAAPTKPITGPSKAISSSSEDDTTSSSSDSSSEEDSDSSSGSSSDSTTDSDSDSDSDASPKPQPIPRKPPSSRQPSLPVQTVTRTAPTRATSSQPPVSPGQGKAATKSRNARRRELRKHQVAGTAFSPQVTTTPALKTATPASMPSGEPITATKVQPSAPIAPAKHANKNKRKGFDRNMAESVATRIVYGTPAPSVGHVEPSVRVDSLSEPALQNKSRYTHYHVVPPSGRKDLPPNVVVTSVDVEAVDGLEEVGEWFDGENHIAHEEVGLTDGVSLAALDYKNKNIDWDIVDSEWERLWDSYVDVGANVWNSLKAGALLGYKGLTIDPSTCTPCTKIHLARVVSSPSSGTGEVECFFVERPGAGDIGFGSGGKFGVSLGPEDDIAVEEAGESRSVAFAEVGGWKIIA
ncbi:unnamed protein product [Rhizoctonia solani]|uniref:Coilin n=1 Tax=Rhizoctonia solani TaxID=456999 RepID=A0A8H3B5R0_9AGAM|nr:unnamed protein product [Rhizoctonia solani]